MPTLQELDTTRTRVIAKSSSATSDRRLRLAIPPPRSSSEFTFTVSVPFGIGTDRVRWSQLYRSAAARHIQVTPGICGGAARIAGTRIPVWTLVRFRQLGASEGELLMFYPRLTRDLLEAAWTYAADHEDDIAAEILRNESA
jgi:uncharacterized protein (DUF433 family)